MRHCSPSARQHASTLFCCPVTSPPVLSRVVLMADWINSVTWCASLQSAQHLKGRWRVQNILRESKQWSDRCCYQVHLLFAPLSTATIMNEPQPLPAPATLGLHLAFPPPQPHLTLLPCSPCRAIPCHAMPCHTTPCHTTPYHTFPHLFVFHTTPYHTISYPAVQITCRATHRGTDYLDTHSNRIDTQHNNNLNR